MGYEVMFIVEMVKAGAKLLDEQKPDWPHLIDFDELDMVKNCVLDQVFAEEAEGTSYEDGFFWALHNLPAFRDDSYLRFGFGCAAGLADVWEKITLARRKQLAAV